MYNVSGVLTYRAPDGHPVLRIRLWRPDEWEQFLGSEEGKILSDPDCAERIAVDAGEGQAVVYLPQSSPGTATPSTVEGDCNLRRLDLLLVDPIIAVVRYGGVVIEARQDGYSDWVEAMQSFVKHLRRR